MAKRMTVIFEDEELYTELKVAAARKGCHAKDIVAAAVREWLEVIEDQELREGLDDARGEYARDGGMELGEFLRQVRAERKE